MTDAITRMTKDAMRTTHNSAIQAAVKMILLCKHQDPCEIAAAVLALMVAEGELKDVDISPASSPNGEAA